MAKIDNAKKSAKELKAIATDKWLTFPPMASADEMEVILSEAPATEKQEETNNTPVVKKDNSKPISDEDNIDLKSLLKEIADLKKLVNTTGDVNKIKDYERSLKTINNFAFSIKLFPTDDGEFPIVSWRTTKNYVANAWKDVNQKVEITYIQEWKETKAEIDLVDFARVLTRSEKLVAKEMKELNWRDVYITKQINPQSKTEYYVMKPENDTFNVTLDYNDQEITILSTYLNA